MNREWEENAAYAPKKERDEKIKHIPKWEQSGMPDWEFENRELYGHDFSEENIEKEMVSEVTTQENCGETVVLSLNPTAGPASLVSREPGELAAIYLEGELTVIGKLKMQQMQ